MPAIERPPQPCPRGLDAAGKRLWKRITERWVLDGREAELLEAACRQSDDNRRLERQLESADVLVTGSAGQTRVNPLMAELRSGRVVVEKLLNALSLPPAEDEAPRTNKRQQLRVQKRHWSA